MFQSHVITNSAMTGLEFLVEHGPKVWDCVLLLCIIYCQFLSSLVFIKFKSQSITTNPYLNYTFIIRKVSL